MEIYHKRVLYPLDEKILTLRLVSSDAFRRTASTSPETVSRCVRVRHEEGCLPRVRFCCRSCPVPRTSKQVPGSFVSTSLTLSKRCKRAKRDRMQKQLSVREMGWQYGKTPGTPSPGKHVALQCFSPPRAAASARAAGARRARPLPAASAQLGRHSRPSPRRLGRRARFPERSRAAGASIAAPHIAAAAAAAAAAAVAAAITTAVTSVNRR